MLGIVRPVMLLVNLGPHVVLDILGPRDYKGTMPNTNTTNTNLAEALNDAIREYNCMSAANTTDHTPEAWDDVASAIERSLEGVSPGRREWFAARARDARLNAMSLRAQGARS
jgi:hypothetical protein